MPKNSSDWNSWGRYPQVKQKIYHLNWRDEALPETSSLLSRGQGRSYGDCCLNQNGTLLSTGRLNRFIEFDREQGILRCEAGVTLDQILDLIVPAGWFLPVLPGTAFVSVGGAIANDIHGKNHHRSGTFGLHVESFILLRSDGTKLSCSTVENTELFQATIAGLGLTGLILEATLKLRKVSGPGIQTNVIPFCGLNEFFQISADSDQQFEYTVGWIDCVSSGKNFARGIFFRGNHAGENSKEIIKKASFIEPAVPFSFPKWVLNRYSVNLFNTVYYYSQKRKAGSGLTHYRPFFFPLDSVKNWNRIYGKDGFLQFQCVVPKNSSYDVMAEILKVTVSAGNASFLAVLKEFGDLESPGLLSFPRQGTTLCLDFAFCGKETIELFQKLESITMEAKGALYPAKDACMSSETFQKSYPRLQEFQQFVDPVYSSSFWRRVQGG